MRRREFITLAAGAAAWPLAARAQQQGSSIAKVGVLWPGGSSPPPPRMESFREGLRRSGYVDGQNLKIELRYAEAGLQQLPDLAADLMRAKVDVIETNGELATKVAQQATSTVPIIALSDDLLGSGLIGSLSRPGGNTTGLTILSPELSAKRLQLIQSVVPGISRIACLWDPASGVAQTAMSENAARATKIRLQILEVKQRDDIERAFRDARDGQAQALNVFSSPFLASLYQEIIALAAKYHLPAIYQWREHTEAGGLMSYGPSLPAMWQQAGAFVAKVLNGAKPSDLPVEQPTKFELLINLKTANALGLTVPLTMQMAADEIIE